MVAEWLGPPRDSFGEAGTDGGGVGAGVAARGTGLATARLIFARVTTVGAGGRGLSKAGICSAD